MIRHGFHLGLLFLIQTLAINALPAIFQPTTPLTRLANGTTPIFITKELSYFPPGPPEEHYLHPILDTDLAILFSPLGKITGRDETIVHQVFRVALYESLDFRTTAKLPGTGYHKQIQNFLLSVTHSVGLRDLTWGMWTIYVRALDEYARAYPGYDFLFELKQYRGWEIQGYQIAAGFVETRTGQGITA
ncbi:MAG: hypothetical protein Q9213_004888 [Squamulea squamosa]